MRRGWKAIGTSRRGQFFRPGDTIFTSCQSLPLPLHWPVWASLDYGFNHPTVVYLLTENDGVVVYIVGEYWARRQLVPQNADGIKTMLAKHGVDVNGCARLKPVTIVFPRRATATAKRLLISTKSTASG